MRACGRQVGQHPGHGGDPDSRADEHGRAAGVVEDDITERQGHGQGVAHVVGLTQQVRHLTVRFTRAVDAFDRELPVFTVVGAGEAVLAGLMHPVGHFNFHRDVLPGQRCLHQPVIDPFNHERSHVCGFRDLLLDLPGSPNGFRSHSAGAVQAAFLIDQRVRHQPVHLIPRGGHLRCHRIAEHVDDGPEQVVINDLILIGSDSQRRVLVPDPGQQVIR